MKLWILRPAKGMGKNQIAPREGDPWSPWYDKVFGFVVEAESADAARRMVASEPDERFGDEGPEAWLDPRLSTCEELKTTGERRVILVEFCAA